MIKAIRRIINLVIHYLILMCLLMTMPVLAATDAILPDSSVYQGKYKNGLRHGTGKLEWRNGDCYEGQFKQGLMHGQGILKSMSGFQYTGEFKDGLMHGQGKYVTDFDGSYTGAFKDGYFHGKGKFVDENGDIYDGLFERNSATGKGLIIYHNSGDYMGDVKQWKMHGQGIYTVTDGDIYSGHFVNGMQQGEGKIVYQSGNVYTGGIDNWRSHGQGELKVKDGSVYHGSFTDGSYDGEGVLTYKNGNVYKGKFKNGLMHGKGEFILARPKGHLKIKTGWWLYGRYQGKEEPGKTNRSTKSAKIKLDAEAIFYSQNAILNSTLATLKPGRPGEPDLYMISFAAYGQQDVFMNEAKFTKDFFDKHYKTKGRSLSLINNPATVEKTLLASVTNLKRVLQHVSGLMNKEEDILFLFLTSHGSKDHKLDVSLRGLPLNDLSATKLGKILKESRIKWKVIVVSSCYSGGFIETLKDESTLIMTSSKADHVSFGCSDEAEFTFFGRAFFKKAMLTSDTFIQAFHKARRLIHVWENDENYDHSEPQLWSTSSIELQLNKWRNSVARGVVH